MALKNFRTHTLAVEFYKECKRLKLPAYIKDQLLRASSSIALNLAEGSGKETLNDQNRFYKYSLTSLREVQSVLELEDINHLKLKLIILVHACISSRLANRCHDASLPDFILRIL